MFTQSNKTVAKMNVIKMLQESCEGSRIYNNDCGRVSYIHVCNDDAVKLIKRLLPYLVVRKEQAKIALDFYDLKQEKFEQCGKYNPAGEEYAGNMETLKIAVHSLNSDQGFKSKE